MKNLKRVVASVLALAMMTGSVFVPAAFGANTSFSDVSAKYSTAVSRLTSLDLVAGYPDGTFGPEKTITRAEAAAIMVRMLGEEDLAKMTSGVSQFTDMSGHWGNGYVNVAYSLGLVKGYPDGTFKPDGDVTYAETLTMMVRALKAGNFVEASGTWPKNIIDFARNEGISTGVTVVDNAKALRGDVAILANTTLDKPMWKLKEGTTSGAATYEKTTALNGGEETLFTETLDLTKFDLATIKTALAVNDDEYSFTADVDLNADGDYADASEANKSFTFASGMEKALTPGEEVDIFTNDDDEVIALQHAKDSDQKVVPFIDVVTNTTGASAEVKVLLTDKTEKTYDYATTSADILDGVTGAKGSSDETKDLMGKLLLNKDGDVTHAYLYNYDSSLIVDEVKYDEANNKYTIKSDSDMPRTSAASLVYTLDTQVVYVKNQAGQAMKLSDIKAGDMVMFAGGSDQYVLVMTPNKVEGTIESEGTETIEVSGTEYEFSPNFEGTATVANYDVDDTVALYLDAMGQVAMLDVTTGAEAAGDYAIITDIYVDVADAKGNVKAKINLFDLATGLEIGVKEFDAEDTDAESSNDLDLNEVGDTNINFYHEVNEELNTTWDETLEIDDLLGNVVKYDVKSDKVTIYEVEADKIVTTTTAIDVSTEKFTTAGGAKYYVAADSVKVYQEEAIDEGTVPMKTIDWATLKDQEAGKKVVLIDIDDDDVASYVYFNDATDAIAKSNSDNIGIITNVRKLSGDNYKVTVMTKDGSQFFYVDKDEADTVGTKSVANEAITLEDATDYAKFVGLLVTYSVDAESFATDANITFDNNIKTAKFYQVSDRNEVELRDTKNVAVDYDKFADMLVMSADITVANPVDLSASTLAGGVTAVAAVNDADVALANPTNLDTGVVSLTLNSVVIPLTNVKVLGDAYAALTNAAAVATALQDDIDAVYDGTANGAVEFTVSQTAGVLKITNDATGVASDVNLTGSNAASATALGFTTVDDSDVAGVTGVKATGTLELVGNLLEGDIITVNGTDCTYVVSGPGAGEFTTLAQLEVLIDAVAGVNSEVNVNKIDIEAAAAGTAGNSITLARTVAVADTAIAFEDVSAAEVADIVETDEDTVTFAAAEAEEKSTVYYYVIDEDDDGAFDTVNGDESVAIMIFNPDQF